MDIGLQRKYSGFILNNISYTDWHKSCYIFFCIWILSSENLSPVRQNENMHNCLVTLQTTNRTLQKCHDILAEKLITSTQWFMDISSTFVRCDVKLLIIGKEWIKILASCNSVGKGEITSFLIHNCLFDFFTSFLQQNSKTIMHN